MPFDFTPGRPPTQRSWLERWTWRAMSILFGTRQLATTHGMLLRFINPIFGYRYPEAIDASAVRLLRLPAAGHDALEGFTLHVFSLDDCPPFRALSYTWGPPMAAGPAASRYHPADRRSVSIDGRPFAMLPNLLQALASVGAAHPGSYLWVDNICINQADLAERAAQVAIMDRIYSAAAETLVWLGPSTDHTRRALPLIRRMAGGARDSLIEWGRRQSFGDAFIADDPQLLQRNGLPPMTADDWADIADVVTRSLFSRVWVIQEIALSCQPTIVIGSDTLPWDALGYTALLIQGSNALTGLYALGSGMTYGPLVVGLVQASNIQLIREWCRLGDSPFRGVLSHTDFAADVAEDSTGDALLALIMASKGCQATVRQDRVYGLLGISNFIAKANGRPPIDLPIDYQTSSDEALISIGCFLYEHAESLNLLSLAGEASRLAPSDLPSWVPSFENVNAPINAPALVGNYKTLRPFRASLDSPSLFHIDETRRRLRVQVSSPNLGSVEELGETWPDIMAGRFLRSITMLLHCGRTYEPTGQPIVEAFWRTLIMDTNLAERPSPADLASSFKAWFFLITVTALLSAWQCMTNIVDIFDSLEPLFTLSNSRDETHLLPQSSGMLAYLASAGFLPNSEIPIWTEVERDSFMNSLCKGAAAYEGVLRTTLLVARRLSRTVRGYLCLVPFRTEVGDKIMIVRGCPVPLVLRRVAGQDDCFHLIGDTYVHGAMYGEHITDDAVWRDITII
jgi:hypothetical protein